MSLVFAAGKKSAAVVKGRDDDNRRPRRQTSSGSDGAPRDGPPVLFQMVHFTSQLIRSVCVYKPSDDVVVWNPTIDGKQQSIALRKSSMDIWFDDERLEYQTSNSASTSRMSFQFLGKKATILHHEKPKSSSESFELIIDGERIPNVPLAEESENN